ncbi:ogr/Delta-like zinc finger family protein, partial [Ralstonia pseudosolanacearum]|uniref:ogr/Delta-like zinc finger family protein n=1 Tax=Ralstonia pseudosolanacearum TaxID=1310165 RepID=UPI0022B0C37A
MACSTAWPRSLALSPSASPEFQLTGVAPPSNSIYATTPIRTSRELSLLSRELYFQCPDVECAYTCRAILSAVNTIAPS